MKIAPILVLGFAVPLAVALPSTAETATGTLTVHTTTTKFCTNPVATTIALGAYDGTAATSGNATVRFKCTRRTPVIIRLRPGSSVVASSNGALNTSPANATPIAYTLTPGNTFTANGSGLGSTAASIAIVPTVNVAANQNPIPGNYSDTINVEVNY